MRSFENDKIGKIIHIDERNRDRPSHIDLVTYVFGLIISERGLKFLINNNLDYKGK